VLEVLLQALDSRASALHGWAIMNETKRSGPRTSPERSSYSPSLQLKHDPRL
jgi:hypothetical protein